MCPPVLGGGEDPAELLVSDLDERGAVLFHVLGFVSERL
jgi:hypothetical protein